MKATGIVRRVDELGRIVLPIELRRVLGIEIGSALEIYASEKLIMLKKYYGSACYFCETADGNLLYFRSVLICTSCQNELIAPFRELAGRAEVAAATSTPSAVASTEVKKNSMKQKVKVKQLEELLVQYPDAKQYELAKMMGISQGYISLLLKSIKDSSG